MKISRTIQIKQLKALKTIVSTGSFSRAAQMLNLTPAAITIQIRTLEEIINGKVLIRSSDGKNSLTSIGKETLILANQIDTCLNQFVQKIDLIKSGDIGRVELGVVSTGKYFAPWIVSLAKEKKPNLDVRLFVANRDEIIEALSFNKIDLAIMGRPPKEPRVNYDTLGLNPHVLVGSPQRKLQNHGIYDDNLSEKLKLDLLEEETFLLREKGSGTRALMDRFLHQKFEFNKLELRELNSNETIKQAIFAGLGIALLAETTVASELKSGRMKKINLKGLPLIREWFIVNKSDIILPPAAKTFRSFILELENVTKINNKN